VGLATARRQASLSLIFCGILATHSALAAWRLAGPFGGSARSIAIDPQNGRTLLAGSRDSLLFLSEDSGTSWRLLPVPAGASGTFDALLIDPAAAGHFYAGLDAGESMDSGIYESRDGGSHWRVLAGTRGLRIESLAMAPANPRLIAAGTSKGVFLSSDDGENWSRISDAGNSEMQDITALAFDPVNSDTIYAGTPHLPWKTTDSGATWHSIATGLIDDSDIFSIRVDSRHHEVVLASACSGLYRSENGGALWMKLRGIPGTHRRTHIVSEDPRDPNVIYAGTTLGLFKSPDAGKTWQHLNGEQVNWMVFDPKDAATFYLATEFAGILKTNDSGKSFSAVNRGFTNHSLTLIAGYGERVYAGSLYEGNYGGLFASMDGGLDWRLLAGSETLLSHNLNGLAVGHFKREVLFASNAEGILKSLDGGKTWSRVSIGPRITSKVAVQRFGRLRIQSLQVTQSEKPLLLAGTDAGLFRSQDAGISWERSGGALTGASVIAIYAPPWGVSRLGVRTRSGFFISSDAGRSWRLATLPGDNDYIYDLALPADPQEPMLAATSRGLFRSTDDGNSWHVVTNGVPEATVNSVRFHPVHPQEAFLIQYGSLYRSLDGGTSWHPIPSEGLENASVHTLWLSPKIPDRIFALSAARGALVFDLPQDVARQADHSIPSSK